MILTPKELYLLQKNKSMSHTNKQNSIYHAELTF